MKIEREDMVSIITPVYNAERFLKETMMSVFSQTYSNWEWLLVDDLSSDSSAQIIEQFAKEDHRIQWVQLPENSGAAIARNKAIDMARGKYLAFIDSDDVWEANKLEVQLAFMQKEGHAFTYTNFSLIDEKGETVKGSVELPQSLDYRGLLKNTAIACSTVMIDREKTGDFRMPLVRKGQDTATWLMLMRERKVRAYALNKVLNHYRQVSGSISSNKFSALKRTWHTYRQLEKLPFHECLYYYLHYVFQAIKRRL
ncbi:glycosyltransferase family 2 protein [Facklamia miroungae]|uniref:Teichuronic acid biosynthesis glycosyltransferase TuaG n=1 Tax=Facklamia miroungae TaxID=120956 RepID=A0A1G7TIW3_9LACT|nr:glycosyltransferase family 2 protein [Facklamia miroungae]NKZ29818.1 glycosyltransferase [Facklamia miroungae]SDG35248.1 teichuronic acid biosynthesis glycosyltransferase TuaG [Facklamia miroungae]